jgi:hypothetical protein
MNIFDKIYEDHRGIKYKLIGFEDNQYKLKVVDSPYSTINEGVTEKKTSLPPKSESIKANG